MHCVVRGMAREKRRPPSRESRQSRYALYNVIIIVTRRGQNMTLHAHSKPVRGRGRVELLLGGVTSTGGQHRAFAHLPSLRGDERPLKRAAEFSKEIARRILEQRLCRPTNGDGTRRLGKPASASSNVIRPTEKLNLRAGIKAERLGGNFSNEQVPRTVETMDAMPRSRQQRENGPRIAIRTSPRSRKDKFAHGLKGCRT